MRAGRVPAAVMHARAAANRSLATVRDRHVMAAPVSVVVRADAVKT
jgi:hypothetical protein